MEVCSLQSDYITVSLMRQRLSAGSPLFNALDIYAIILCKHEDLNRTEIFCYRMLLFMYVGIK